LTGDEEMQGAERKPLYGTIRWRMFTCAQKLANSQLNLPHRTKQKRLMKKLKIKTEMLRRNGPVYSDS